MTEDDTMLMSVLNCRRIDLYADKLVLSQGQREIFDQMKKRREQGEPLQYIIGEAECCGLMFNVDERVLIPRPETELMIETVLPYLGHRTVHALDVGTGSGCIAVSLAKRNPALICHAIDISYGALTVAKANVKRHCVDSQVTLEHVGAQEFLRQTSVPIYDMIISNPPYISTSEMGKLPSDVKREPPIALDGGKDGLDYYRILIQHASSVLKLGGLLVCEFWDGQDRALRDMLGEFWDVRFYQDLSGVNRFFIAQLEDAHAEAHC